MHTQTIERQELQRVIDTLPDDSVVAMLDFAKKLRPHSETVEWVDPIDAGTPNVKTLEAIRELEEGGGITFETTKELFNYLDS
jgi:hypothetical protein